MLELRRTLLHERRHAFRFIFRGEGGMEQSTFESDTFCQGGFICSVDTFLRDHQHRLGQLANFLGHRDGLVQ